MDVKFIIIVVLMAMLVTIGSTFPYWMTPNERNNFKVSRESLIPNVVVALDGTGDYTRIMDAVHAAADYQKGRFVIYVKQGVYEENVNIDYHNITLYGDGMDKTVITGNRHALQEWTTFTSATVAVTGAGFIGRDLTVENTAMRHQAVAFRSDSDHSVLYRCAFRGYQDTLYAHGNKQFYRECVITGTVDFIFGDATAVFQNCQILARNALPHQKNTITAHGRNGTDETTGFTIQFCNISRESSSVTTDTYLGRPWRSYSRTIIMESYIGDLVNPQGWLEWDGREHLDTLDYAEYKNTGPGASLANRVKWPGFHVLNTSSQALQYTVGHFLSGDTWLPETGVNFTSGL